MSGIREKHRITQSLKNADLAGTISELLKLPVRQVINPLFAGLSSADETIRWPAITAMGAVVARLAEDDMEAARVLMRRLMWSLNDESGGIGWGAPEAMAEIMACHDGLAVEYTHILVSYTREDGNFLEHVPMQRGVVWGVGRLARSKTDLLIKNNAVQYLLPYLDTEDAAVKGLTARALGLLKAAEATDKLGTLCNDLRVIRLFLDRQFVTMTVGGLAEKAVNDIMREK